MNIFSPNSDSVFYFSPCSHIINASRLWFIEAIASISRGPNFKGENHGAAWNFHDKILKVIQPNIKGDHPSERDFTCRDPGHLPPASAKLLHSGCSCLGPVEKEGVVSVHICGLDLHRDIPLRLLVQELSSLKNYTEFWGCSPWCCLGPPVVPMAHRY